MKTTTLTFGLGILSLCLAIFFLSGMERLPPQAPAAVASFATAPTVTATSYATALPPTATATPTPVATATAVGPTTIPTPTPRTPGTPWRVGVQVGHLRSDELPAELTRLRSSSGTRYGSLTEAEVNAAIVLELQKVLEAAGVVVDVLPATVPPSYDSDAFVAIHSDGNPSAQVRGWKMANPWRVSRAAQQLLEAIRASYATITRVPEDLDGITFNMRGYYAFSTRRFMHAIANTTPAVIIETGYLTNAADRQLIVDQPQKVAQGIADGMLAYLRARDPNDGAALLPPNFPLMRAREAGVAVRSAPRDSAGVLLRIDPDTRFMPISAADGWYEGIVRGGGRVVGWVKQDQLESTSEPFVLPTPSDSH